MHHAPVQADVNVGLRYAQPNKPAWNPGRVMEYFRKNRGKRFDPRLVDILLENSAEFIALNNQFPD